MIKKLLLLCLLPVPALLHAQGENNNWTFGKNEGYNFNQGNPPQTFHTIQPGTSFLGGNASVSDANGNLLFYTSGYGVVDATNTLMPNGILNGGLIPQGLLPHKELGQEGVYILPDVADTNKYFIFTYVDTTWQTGAGPILPRPTSKLRYSVVDMSLNNGLGDVVSGQKDLLLAEDVTLGMAAVRAADCGFWLVTHTSTQNPDYPNQYLAFKVDESGVHDDPVVSTGLLPGYREITLSDVYMQRLKMAPDGKKIAAIRGFFDTLWVNPAYDTLGAIIGEDSLSTPTVRKSTRLEIGDFDAATGMVSGLGILCDTFKTYRPFASYPLYDGPTCIEFSGNSQYLYVSQYKKSTDTIQGLSWGYDYRDSSCVYQYDAMLNDVNSIKQSKHFVYGNLQQTVYSIMNNGLDPICMRKTPDGDKIIMTDFDYDADTVSQTNSYTNGLNCITDINSTDPGFIEDYITRGDSTLLIAIWPVFSYDLGMDTWSRRDTLFALALDTLTCADLSLTVPEGYHSPLWSDGSTEEQHTLTAGATYWLQYENDCHVKIDTFIISLNPPPTPIITIDIHTLATVQDYESYQWLQNGALIPGATESTYTVTENGDYRVIVGNAFDCTDTSEVYTVNNITGIGNVHALAGAITVYPNPAQSVINVKAPVPVSLSITGIEGKVIQTATQATSLPITELAEGSYLLHIWDKDGLLIKVQPFAKTK